jgi:adenosine kinase
MRLAVTGSIATDHLMTFDGSFSEQLLDGQLEHVSLSFLAERLEIRRGGVAANICYGLGQLGLNPVLVGAVGSDFEPYRIHLKAQGVNTDSVLVSEELHTARFVCTTDRTQNQIGTFYAGAMAEARNIALSGVIERAGGLQAVIIAPDDPAAMLRHTEAARDLRVPFAADPSQQLALLAPEEVRELITGAHWLFTNEYEAELLRERTGWTEQQVLQRVGRWVTTRGAEGVRISRQDAAPVTVPAIAVDEALDPTGVGDAFRAGFFAALAWSLPEQTAAQFGCALASIVLGHVGTQEYQLTADALVERLRTTYGGECAARLIPHLRRMV